MEKTPLSDSIYAPPEADLTVPNKDLPRYYVVSPRKFLLLSLLTTTYYFYYWFYRNWRQIKEDDNDDLWAPARSIFFVFFTHALFTDVQENLKNQDRGHTWQPALLATVFVLLVISSNVFGFMVSYEESPLLSGLVPMTTVVLSTFLLLPAQKAINVASSDEGGDTNSNLTGANWAWMVVGGVLWLLMLVGTFADFLVPLPQ